MAHVLDYDIDHGKLEMIFVLLRLKRRQQISSEESLELDALLAEQKSWSPWRRRQAARALESFNAGH